MNYENFSDTISDDARRGSQGDRCRFRSGKARRPSALQNSDSDDGRDHANGLEDEMARRNMPFIPVRFPDRSGR